MMVPPTLNDRLFMLLTRYYGECLWFDQLATILARGLPWLVGLWLAMLWLRRRDAAVRRELMIVELTGLLGLVLGLAALWLLPTPELKTWTTGNLVWSQRSRSSLPSPALIFMLAASLTALRCRHLRRVGIGLLAVALVDGILRVYVRLHLPFYLFSSGGIALLTVALGWGCEKKFLALLAAVGRTLKKEKIA